MSSLESRISSLETQLLNLLELADQRAGRIVELEAGLAARDERISSLEAAYEEALAEIRRLKKLPPKPALKPSKLDDPAELAEGSDKEASGSKPKRPGSAKAKKKENLEIHAEEVVSAQEVPLGWLFSGYEPYVVQDMLIEAHNIRYQREVWVSPDGGDRIVAQLPTHLRGKHFGETLRAYVLYQYYHCGVSQPLIHQALAEFGVSISSGMISELLTQNQEVFHAEKRSLLHQAIELKQELRTDDTGARHQFKNGFCNCINSDLFTYFTTSASKSRINFLEILRREYTDYQINESALAYAAAQALPPRYYTVLAQSLAQGQGSFADYAALEAYFEAHGWKAAYALRTITEALLIGSLIHHGFDPETLIHSDGAPQFNLFVHSLCWKHAERPLIKLRCYNQTQEALLQEKQQAFWELYQQLKAYKAQPQPQQIDPLTQRFEKLCEPVPNFESLNQVLEELNAKQPKLLRVLTHPQASLHNNDSERDIREYVKRRKISAGTRSELGKQARDTFLSLKKTAQKLGLSFWKYLLDRITQAQQIPPLSDIMQRKMMDAS